MIFCASIQSTQFYRDIWTERFHIKYHLPVPKGGHAWVDKIWQNYHKTLVGETSFEKPFLNYNISQNVIDIYILVWPNVLCYVKGGWMMSFKWPFVHQYKATSFTGIHGQKGFMINITYPSVRGDMHG